MHYVDLGSSYGKLSKKKKKGKSQSSSGLPFDLTNHRDSGRFEIPDLSTFDTEIQRLREKTSLVIESEQQILTICESKQMEI